MTEPAASLIPLAPAAPAQPAGAPLALPAPPAVAGAPNRLRLVLRTLLAALLLLALALACVAAAGWNYDLLLQFSAVRRTCLLMIILSGGAATLSLGGVMLCLDRLLDLTPPPHWSWRLLIDPAKRLLLAGQLVTTALVLVALGILLLGRAIPNFR